MIDVDCRFVTKGKTKDEILSQYTAHLARDHGITSELINQELEEKMNISIHKSWF